MLIYTMMKINYMKKQKIFSNCLNRLRRMKVKIVKESYWI